MENHRVSYIYDQISKAKIDSFVIDGTSFEVLEGEELLPVMVEDCLYLELRRDGKVISFLNFWKIDEVHYAETDEQSA